MTDIEQARAVLDKWKDEAVQGPWKFNEDGWLVVGAAEFGGRFADVGGDLGTAALIVGTAGNPDLLDAIDGLLAGVLHWATFASVPVRVEEWAERIAAAIIAADQRINA